jgi:hypothetical protein
LCTGGFPNCSKSDSVFATIRGEDDHGKGLFDRLEKKTAEELASMIRQDLSEVDACPRRGVNVTVYGLNPWNSMLTFGVDAGPVHNKAYLQSFCDIITERLKRLDDI